MFTLLYSWGNQAFSNKLEKSTLNSIKLDLLLILCSFKTIFLSKSRLIDKEFFSKLVTKP
jgi:hypothetical protein